MTATRLHDPGFTPWRGVAALAVCLLVAAGMTSGASATTAASEAPASAAKRTGGWRLHDASSPYLRMHADNPVEWYPWGEEALAKARAENKPLFISIGYFTCHWCHVMERESFRNPEIARLLNDGFIAIKVDREQRPDIDAAYMSFVVATQGQGGWPMTILALPDGTPFFGGTYFPPEPRGGLAGLKQLLPKARALWDRDRPKLVATSREAVRQLRQLATAVPALARFTDEAPASARRWFRAQYDPMYGGFGSGQKFPLPPQLLFLLQDGDRQSADMALHTLDQMAAGGIHDQLEGGFHRYATDPAWRVPHFEKMLYDQALIARAYLSAYRRTGERRYAEVARRTLDFALQHMRHAQGGFYSALSADSAADPKQPAQMEEGAYYVWDWRQLREAIPDAALRQWAVARYGLTEDGNVTGRGTPELSGQNVLYIARDDAELARDFGVDIGTARERTAAADRLLLSARRQRPAPPRDDKIVTAWNGYMITALAEAAQLLGEARYRRAAEETSRFVLGALYDGRRGRLYRDWREGRRGGAGFAEDYAALTEALLALYAVDANKDTLAAARRLTAAQIRILWDPQAGGFYDTGRDTRLWIRDKTASDGVTPSANAVTVGNLLRLGALTGDRTYLDMAARTAAWQGGLLRETPEEMPYTLAQWPILMAPSEKAGQAR